jgi:hypothetical protein
MKENKLLLVIFITNFHQMLLLELMDTCYCFDIQNRVCVCVCVQHLLVIVPLHKHLSNFIFFQGTRQIISLVMIMREQCSKNFTGSSNHIRLGFLAIMFLMVHTYILIST